MSNMRKNIPPGNRPVASSKMTNHTARVQDWYGTEWKALLMRARLAGIRPDVVCHWNSYNMWGAWGIKNSVLLHVEVSEKHTH